MNKDHTTACVKCGAQNGTYRWFEMQFATPMVVETFYRPVNRRTWDCICVSPAFPLCQGEKTGIGCAREYGEWLAQRHPELFVCMDEWLESP